MNRSGRFAGSLAAMLISVALHIGAPPGHGGAFVVGRAWAASVAAAGLARNSPNLTRILPSAKNTGPVVPFQPPSLAALTVPVLAIGMPTEALADFAKALLFWPVALITGVAAWLVRLRAASWRGIAVRQAGLDATLSVSRPEPAPEPLPAALVPASEPVAASRGQAQGADLAARARFVAMTFAFPETGIAQPGPIDWPLQMNCQPTRFNLTLQHAALGYRLAFCNRGAEPLGPLIIRADLVAETSRMAQHHPVGCAADALPLCHYLDSLPAGDTMELTGELRLPLAGIAAMRLGTAELLVPLMRLCAESAGECQPVLSVSAGFAIGLPPLSAGGGIQPFRLDLGPAIWRKLTARRLPCTDLS